MSGTPKEQGLSMEALVGQLGDSAEFSSLRQKVTQISKSKVLCLLQWNDCIDKSVGSIASPSARKVGKKCTF